MSVPPSPPAEQTPDQVQRAIDAVRAQKPMPWRPRPLPLERRFLLAVQVAMVVCMLGWMMMVFVFKHRSGAWTFTLLMLYLGFVIAISFSRTVGRVAAMKLIVPARGMVCPECHFILDERIPEGVCPECGTRYSRPDLIRMWRSKYSLRAHLPDLDAELNEKLRKPQGGGSDPSPNS